MKKIYSLILCCAVLFSACDKEMIADKVTFDVTTDAQSYQAGDTVKFIFTGNPDNIAFFSGEVGSKYQYRKRLEAEGTPQLQFTSYRQYGTQLNTMQLLASTDFNGTVDASIMDNGTWLDITDRAVFSTGADNTPSGIIDLTEFQGKPLYLAFRFLGISNASAQRTWTIKNFKVENLLDDGVVLSVADMSSAGWTAVSLKNPEKEWKVSVDELRFAGGPANTPDNDDWVVTKPLNLNKVNPDRGAALKNISSKLDTYSYVYDQPGEYIVTFVATNATADDQKSVVKEVKVKVNP